jgi:GNAT superfamily N-acetyltransferase
LSKSPEVAIRQATIEDAPRILAAVVSHYKETNNSKIGGILDVPFVIAVIEENLTCRFDDGVVYIAEDDVDLIGFILGRSLGESPLFLGQRIAGEPFWWVREGHRRTGLGLTLLRMLEDWAVKTGHDYIQGGAMDDRIGKVWERMGYSNTGVIYMKRISNGAV